MTFTYQSFLDIQVNIEKWGIQMTSGDYFIRLNIK